MQALTKGGFKSSLRDLSKTSSSAAAAALQAKRDAKMKKMQDATFNLVFAWVSRTMRLGSR